MGDSFVVSDAGHVCDRDGPIITYRRARTTPEYEVIVTHTPARTAELIDKTARSILRIKSRVVKVSPDLVTGAEATRLELVPGQGPRVESIVIEGPQATLLFDALVEAQREMSRSAKTDPAWTKRR
jgi:hypothetical protein